MVSRNKNRRVVFEESIFVGRPFHWDLALRGKIREALGKCSRDSRYLEHGKQQPGRLRTVEPIPIGLEGIDLSVIHSSRLVSGGIMKNFCNLSVEKRIRGAAAVILTALALVWGVKQADGQGHAAD